MSICDFKFLIICSLISSWENLLFSFIDSSYSFLISFFPFAWIFFSYCVSSQFDFFFSIKLIILYFIWPGSFSFDWIKFNLFTYKKEYKDKNKEYLKKHIFEENIEKPIFYNSKKNNNEEEIKANNEEPKKKNYILIKNIIKLENIKETILAKKNEQTQIVKEEIEKNLEKEYGSLNINATWNKNNKRFKQKIRRR